MLTIFKQARAHGLGMVVATQNPVDLDYKLMSNAGTWMVGRLQTERDKARIIEAMRSSSGDVDVAAWDARIGELGKREFVLKTARTSQPTTFISRWAMSFLRGPLTRTELLKLRDLEGTGGPDTTPGSGDAPTGAAGTRPAGTSGAAGQTGRSGDPSDAAASPAAPVSAELADDETLVAPTVSDEARTGYLDPAAPWAASVGAGEGPGSLHAGVAFRVKLLFDEQHADVRHEEEWEAVLFPLTEELRAEDAVQVDYDDRDFRSEPVRPAPFVLPAVPVQKADYFRSLSRDLQEHLFRARTLEIWRNPDLKLHGRVDETEDAFRARCLEAAEQEADREGAKLRDGFERKLETARGRRDQAARRVRELEVDAGARQQQEIVAGAGELLSMFLGGKARVRSLSGIASRRSQTRRTEERLTSAAEKVEDYERAIADLEDELARDMERVWEEWRAKASNIESLQIPLEKTDILVQQPMLFWAPRA